ncbi:MAG: S8 family peptidase [Deltaproteobacteria bacterium]|nr:S8 family peptidase [Deltaproteobacteria bacterium]
MTHLQFPVALPGPPLVTNVGSPFRIGVPLDQGIRGRYDVHLDPYEVQPVVFQAGSQVVDWGVKLLKAQEVHAKTRGEKAAVFILDTAGQFDHPDLAANALQQYAKNFSDAPTLEDKHGHGTHCAGLAAAVDNDLGVLGMAPGAKLVPVKVLNDSGSGSWEGVANGIRYVADLEVPFIKVISMSLGGSGGNAILQSAVEYALAKGCFIVAAAGNSGYRGKDTVGYPAKYPGVITVASIGNAGTPSSFSSGGPILLTQGVAAPGENNLSTHKGGEYVRMSGTSMATPHVAGALAMILSAHPEITTPKQMLEFLMKGAADLLDPGPDVRTGAGAPVMTAYIV